MYKKINCDDDYLKFNSNNILDDLQNKINDFLPDFILSAISSHIHGEGEHVNIQNGYDLLKDLDKKCNFDIRWFKSYFATEIILKKMNKINYLIRGESELVLLEALNNYDDCVKLKNNTEDLKKLTEFLILKIKNFIKIKQKIINDLDKLSPYDYDIFDNQSLIRFI